MDSTPVFPSWSTAFQMWWVEPVFFRTRCAVNPSSLSGEWMLGWEMDRKAERTQRREKGLYRD